MQGFGLRLDEIIHVQHELGQLTAGLTGLDLSPSSATKQINQMSQTGSVEPTRGGSS